jgi:hypothetical protein
MKTTANPSLILFHAAFFWRYLSMMRRHYVRSYGAFGAQSRYRIKPAATPRPCSDVWKAGRWGFSTETQQLLLPAGAVVRDAQSRCSGFLDDPPAQRLGFSCLSGAPQSRSAGEPKQPPEATGRQAGSCFPRGLGPPAA